MFNWFDGEEARAFGVSLADFFASRIPATAVPAGDQKSLRKVGEIVAKLHLQAASFRSSHPLNVFKRAKLANSFQWRLLELGYDKTVVKELAREIARSL